MCVYLQQGQDQPPPQEQPRHTEPIRRSPEEEQMQPQFGLDQQPRQRQMGRRSGRFRKQPPDAYRYVQGLLLTMTLTYMD